MLKFKRGASFLFSGVVKLNGTVQDMTGWTLECDIKVLIKSNSGDTIGNLIKHLPISWSNAASATVTLGDDSDTSAWPIGYAVVDIKATSPGGTKVLSQTETVQIMERVTQ
jgi:hypothetical protein